MNLRWIPLIDPRTIDHWKLQCGYSEGRRRGTERKEERRTDEGRKREEEVREAEEVRNEGRGSKEKAVR